MGFEPTLTFDGLGAYEALGAEFEAVIQSLTNTVMEMARANLGGDSFYDEVRMTLQGRLISLAQTGIITGQIGSDAWQSWIAEWGSGSEMDRNNPDLAAYMGSELWNPVREGFDITGRPNGPYLGLDGEMHESSGNLAGVSLEWLVENDPAFKAWTDATVGPDAFKPKIPLHFMRDAIEANRNLIIDQLNAVLEKFNFSAFFV